MTVVGLVVQINSEDFNVARVLSTIDRKSNGGGASFDASANNFVSGTSCNTSGLDVNSARQNGRRSPLTVDDGSAGRGGSSVLAAEVLKILGLVGSLGISGISGIRSSERSGRDSSSIHTNNGNGIGGGRSEAGDLNSGEVDIEGGGSSSGRGDGHNPRDAPSGGILPGQAQIVNVVSVIWSQSTSREGVGKIDWGAGREGADGVGIRI